jgi:hypothetical protein
MSGWRQSGEKAIGQLLAGLVILGAVVWAGTELWERVTS